MYTKVEFIKEEGDECIVISKRDYLKKRFSTKETKKAIRELADKLGVKVIRINDTFKISIKNICKD